jgi:hypothetical protein
MRQDLTKKNETSSSLRWTVIKRHIAILSLVAKKNKSRQQEQVGFITVCPLYMSSKISVMCPSSAEHSIPGKTISLQYLRYE